MAERFCEICQEEIDEDRREGLPDTRLCTTHAREIQRYGGEFRLVSQQERTSKAGSLKINYGGVATRKERNHEALRRLQDAWERRS
ncbi:hypothetical protein [Anatilimnocola floriformis]|uniref:hypothetical protein n=1 Tax=Anatilimnocola floriformis TaxID=2948575 RepID=UPI0020C3498B|nr:hypothetical protein [Anatilimnocola floriformis]